MLNKQEVLSWVYICFFIMVFSCFLEMSMKTLRRRCVASGNLEEKGNQRREKGREQPKKNELQHFDTSFLLFFYRGLGLYISQWQNANPKRVRTV